MVRRSEVKTAYRFLKLASFFVLLSVLASYGQGQTGGVSSTVTAAATSTPGASNATPLPWKFLAGPMGVLNSPALDKDMESLAGCSDPKAAVPSEHVTNLLSATIGPTAAAKLAGQQAQYVVIHVVDPTSGPTGSDAWYLYRSAKGNFGDPKWDCQKFSGQRLYGAPSVLFLFLHRHAKAVSLSSAREQVRNALTAAKAKSDTPPTPLTKGLLQVLASTPSDSALDAALKTNALDTSLKAPDLQAVTFCDAVSGDHFQWLGDNGVPSTSANLHYESAVVKRTPANIANLKMILGLLFGAQSKEASCLDIASTDVTVWGAGRIQNIGLPSDISIAGYSVATGSPLKEEDRAAKQIGAVGAYNDEQLYWWDASIGIPVHQIKDLQYSDSNDTVVASQVSKQSAYAMFNLMLHPVDLSDPGSNVWPRLLVGFPLASSPWDKLFAGGAIGIPLKPFRNFQFFAGVTFIRDKQPATLTAGSSATDAELQNDLRIKTTLKFTFGINIPVKSVIDKLK